MKKAIFIISTLILLPMIIQAQSDSTVQWNDISIAADREDDDLFVIRRQDDVYRISTETFLQDVNERVDSINSDIATTTSHPSNTNNPHMVTDVQVLPSMTGNAGKLLITTGYLSQWSDTVRLDTLYLTGGGKLYADASGNLVLDDEQNEPLVLSDLLSSGSSFETATIGTINEYATSQGVTVEGVVMEDGDVSLPTGSSLYLDGGVNSYLRQISTMWRFTLSGETVLDIAPTNLIFSKNAIPGGDKTISFGNPSFYWDNFYTDRLFIDNGSTYIDVSGTDMTLTSAATGTVLLSDLIGGTSYWAKSGTSLSPATAGDDILLATNTERILFGTGTTYIYENSAGVIQVYCAGAQAFQLASTAAVFYQQVMPTGDKVHNLGGLSNFWDNGFFDRLYIDNTSTYIDVSGTDMTLTSAAAGTVNLADLTGGGGSDLGDTISRLWAATFEDTISIDTAVHMLVDTLVVVGGAGLGNAGDTASMQVGANILDFPVVQNSIIFDSIYAYCEKTSGNVTIRPFYQSAPGGTKTYITAAISVTTGTPGGTSTFTTVKLGPGVFLGCDITAVGAILPDKLRVYLFYHEKRAY